MAPKCGSSGVTLFQKVGVPIFVSFGSLGLDLENRGALGEYIYATCRLCILWLNNVLISHVCCHSAINAMQ